MNTTNVIAILGAASSLMSNTGWCQGSYGLDSNSNPVTVKTDCTQAGMTAYDTTAALYVAAENLSLQADLADAMQALADYVELPPHRREFTHGAVLTVWNDEPGRQASEPVDQIATVIVQLSQP